MRYSLYTDMFVARKVSVSNIVEMSILAYRKIVIPNLFRNPRKKEILKQVQDDRLASDICPDNASDTCSD